MQQYRCILALESTISLLNSLAASSPITLSTNATPLVRRLFTTAGVMREGKARNMGCNLCQRSVCNHWCLFIFVRNDRAYVKLCSEERRERLGWEKRGGIMNWLISP
jgi:hypothetical protein